MKIAPEVALEEFNRFTDAMDIDGDTSRMDDEDRNAFNKQRNRILGAIEAGALIINEDGEAVYTPQNAKSGCKAPIHFHERTGASLMAADKAKKGHDAAKTYAVMADMCQVHPSTFAGLVGSDIKICEALFALLMD